MFGPILAIFGHGRPYFFIDARDGTAGGRVGGRMSRASMKKNKKLASRRKTDVLKRAGQLVSVCTETSRLYLRKIFNRADFGPGRENYFDSMHKVILLIHVWVPRNPQFATKCVKFRFPEFPIPFSSARFRAGSIFEV